MFSVVWIQYCVGFYVNYIHMNTLAGWLVMMKGVIHLKNSQYFPVGFTFPENVCIISITAQKCADALCLMERHLITMSFPYKQHHEFSPRLLLTDFWWLQENIVGALRHLQSSVRSYMKREWFCAQPRSYMVTKLQKRQITMIKFRFRSK